MLYRSFKDLRLSAMGLGCMRFPILNGQTDQIDLNAAGEMVDYALKSGVNYFDTAWGYHGGQSEIVTGKLLSSYPRDSYYLASKFPGFHRANMANKEEIFEKQLEKCGVDHFDFYLFPNVCEDNAGAYLEPQYGILEYLLEQKRKGRIGHLGCSVHARLDTMERFLDGCGGEIEFVQIQLNYLDWNYQDAKAKVECLQQRGLPIWVMEPLRGGRLANLTPEQEATLRALRPDTSIPAWSYRFLQSIGGLGVVLSGASSLEQLKENVAAFSEHAPLNEAERAAVLTIAQDLLRHGTVPCTACRYCVEHCPQTLDIPELLRLYNKHALSGAQITLPEHGPADCVACRACESSCPQKIAVADVLADFAAQMAESAEKR